MSADTFKNIKVITVRQPYATLLLFLEKHFETRTMFTKHKGMYLLHSAKKMEVMDKILCNDPVVKTALQRCGINHFKELPTGQILGSFRVDKCLENRQTDKGGKFDRTGKKNRNLTPGNLAWEVKDMRHLINPILYTNGPRHIPKIQRWG